jgi:hypothetical protein
VADAFDSDRLHMGDAHEAEHQAQIGPGMVQRRGLAFEVDAASNDPTVGTATNRVNG